MVNSETGKKPLWLLIEDQILGLGDSDISGGSLENAVQKVAGALDAMDLNVSNTAGHMFDIRNAIDERIRTGRALMKDINDAVAALTLDDVISAHDATMKIINTVGEACPQLKIFEKRSAIMDMVEKTRLDLLTARANELGDDKGIRFMIESEVAPDVIIESLGISKEKLAEVNAAIEAELAEIQRVKGLLEEAKDKSDEDKVKHLINSDVAEALIVEVGGFGKDVIDSVNKAMEEEIKEKQRLAEEAEAKKKAEAEGPPIEDIPADQMLDFIETIRDILDMTEVEAEVRQMCEQSSLPKALIEIAVNDKSKLDELEQKAEAEG